MNVKKHAERIRDKMSLVGAFSSEDGVIYFKFENFKSRDAVLEERAWHIAKQPMIHKKWQRMVKVSRDDIRMVPVWIRFYNIPFEFWNEEGQVASKVGKPL